MKKAKIKNTDTNDEIRQFKAMKQDEYWISNKTTKGDVHSGVKAILNNYGKTGGKRNPEDGDLSEKQDWKKLKAEKKELKMKRKEKNLGSSERYELSVQTKKIWEELRQGSCKKDRQKELCRELMLKVQGKLKSLIYAHDTVRVIETLLAKGGEECRTLVFEELKDDLVNLSKIKYSRFFVLKILRYGSKAQKDHVISSLKGEVVKLMKHKIASDVVELAYNDYANAKQRAMMVQEFFGPQFRLFHEEDVKCIDDALKKHPEMKDYILKDFRGALQPIIDKGVFTNTMVHTLLKDFLSYCSAGDRNGIIEALKESLVPIIHTRDGARVAMLCLWHGTNKDRKTILKSFRTHFVKIALEEHGHMVLLAAFDCVDDTQFMKKVVLSELMEELDKLVGSDYGLRVLRYLVAPRSPTFFQPSVLAVLAQGDGNQASKKDTVIRQRELQAAVSIPILRLLLGNLQHWAVNPNWTLFIGAAVKTLVGPERETMFHKLAEMYAKPYIPGTEGHVLELAHTTKMVTYIIKCDKERHEAQQVTFSSILIKNAGEELLGWTNCNRGCFLLANMMETEISEIVSHIQKLIAPHKDNLVKLNSAGAQVLLKKV